MKTSMVMKPAMLFAAGTAASVANAQATVDTTTYNAADNVSIYLANSRTAQYTFNIQPVAKANDDIAFGYVLQQHDGKSTVTANPFTSASDAQNAPSGSFGPKATTGIVPDQDIPQRLAASSDTYYGLRFSANGTDYRGYAGVINGGATINQIGYEPLAAAPVPEPETWALMIAGFGGAGLAMRRRRRQASAAAVA